VGVEIHGSEFLGIGVGGRFLFDQKCVSGRRRGGRGHAESLSHWGGVA
jgi:hypothetical protein